MLFFFRNGKRSRLVPSHPGYSLTTACAVTSMFTVSPSVVVEKRSWIGRSPPIPNRFLSETGPGRGARTCSMDRVLHPAFIVLVRGGGEGDYRGGCTVVRQWRCVVGPVGVDIEYSLSVYVLFVSRRLFFCDDRSDPCLAPKQQQ